MKKEPSRHITNKEDLDYIFGLTNYDLCKLSVLIDLFGAFNGKSRFHVYDTIDIPPGAYGKEGFKNKNTYVTTLGRWVWNKIFIEEDLMHLDKPYYNECCNKKLFKKINGLLSHGVLEGKIGIEELKRYLLKTQKIMPLVTVLMNSETEAMYLLADKIEPKKRELLKKYKKEIDEGKDYVISQIEKDLIEYAKELLQDDGSLDVFDNDESADYSNNFKNMFVMKGLVKRNGAEGYNLITGSYMRGIDKEEYVYFADSLAAGPYARSRKTATGGYWEKLFRIFEHVVLDKPGSDCGTKRTIEITLTKDMLDYVYYSYIQEGNKLIELTSDNVDKYLNKTVRIRFSSLCESKNGKICSKCAGNKFYRLGIKNIGNTVPQVGSKIKNINMKAFHDSQVVFHEMDPMKAFYPFGTDYKKAVNEDMEDYGVHLTTLTEQGELNHQSLLAEMVSEQDQSQTSY